jgi:hypothetical protein
MAVAKYLLITAFTFDCAAAFGAWRYIQRLEEEMLFLRSSYLQVLILKKVCLWSGLDRFIRLLFPGLVTNEQTAREQAEVYIPYVGIRSLRLGDRSKCHCC